MKYYFRVEVKEEGDCDNRYIENVDCKPVQINEILNDSFDSEAMNYTDFEKFVTKILTDKRFQNLINNAGFFHKSQIDKAKVCVLENPTELVLIGPYSSIVRKVPAYTYISGPELTDIIKNKVSLFSKLTFSSFPKEFQEKVNAAKEQLRIKELKQEERKKKKEEKEKLEAIEQAKLLLKKEGVQLG